LSVMRCDTVLLILGALTRQGIMGNPTAHLL
jgi:hypothetical protein